MHEQFHWTSPAGVEVTLPHINKVKAGLLRKLRKTDPVDQLFSLAEAVADKATLDKLDDLTIEEINDLFEKWQEATTSAGESSRSST